MRKRIVHIVKGLAISALQWGPKNESQVQLYLDVENEAKMSVGNVVHCYYGNCYRGGIQEDTECKFETGEVTYLPTEMFYRKDVYYVHVP